MTPWMIMQWCFAIIGVVITVFVLLIALVRIARAVLTIFEYIWK